jgi:hypothetical protein
MAPAEADFTAAARWSIRVPDINLDAVSEVFLRITYQGDVARLYAGKRLITDDFYHGVPWEISLRNIAVADRKQGLELQILPLRQDAPIYLAAGAWPAAASDRQAAANRDSVVRKLGPFDPRVAEFHSGRVSSESQTARLIDIKVIPYYRALADLRP